MTLRTFVDSAGNEWDAFDVIPRAEERRAYERRNSGAVAVEGERRESDRRVTVGGRSMLNPNLNQGWLCFERGADRRRLTPIPDNWQQYSDAELEALREAARAVRLNPTSLKQMTERDH
jgi:hypothetical protein